MIKLDFNSTIIQQDMESIFSQKCDWETIESKSFFVTGGYGMLASYVVCFLMYLNIKKGFHIKVNVQGRDLAKARARFADFWNNSFFEFHTIDICSPVVFDKDVDFIIHAAGISNPRRYNTNPIEVISPNVLGTYHLLNLARDKSVSGFLFFSSGSVYGDCYTKKDITEDMMGAVNSLNTHSCYEESKRMGETLCASFCRQHGLRTIIARIGHTYGPTMNVLEDPRVFASFMRCLLMGEDIVILSDGTAERSFCYLSDAVAGFFIALQKGKGGEAYNIVNSSQTVSVSELASTMAAIPDNKVNVKYGSREKSDNYLQVKESGGFKLSNEKMRLLGWEPGVHIEDGFRRVYEYLHSIN